MSYHKISPWKINIEQDENFIKKIERVHHLNSNYIQQGKGQVQSNNQLTNREINKLKRYDNKILSQNKLQPYFNNCLKSQPTRFELIQKSLKLIKIQPKTLNSKIRLMSLLTNQNGQKPLELASNTKRNKQEEVTIRKSHKQIYYNLTELNSPLYAMRNNKKCYTERMEQNNSKKLESISMLTRERLKSKLSASQQLLLEKKVFQLQSGERSLRCEMSKDKCLSKKQLRTCDSIQEKIEYVMKKYSIKKGSQQK